MNTPWDLFLDLVHIKVLLQDREQEKDFFFAVKCVIKGHESAKVHSAIRCAQKRSEFVHFEAYRLRVLESRSGREIGVLLGVSEPTVTRHCQRVRDVLREELRNAIEQWSFTEDERAEPVRAGLAVEDALFDEALGEIWRAQEEILALDLRAQMAARDRDPKRGQA